jgi:ribosome-associated protein
MIRISPGIVIDDREIEFDFIRSSGPGGQNVNKVSTAVRLRFDVHHAGTLPSEVRNRLIHLAGKRVGDDGFLMILARRGRTQESNRRDAIARLVALVEKACEKPRPRRATRPTVASRERRLETKRRRALTKETRKPRAGNDD